VEVSGIVTPDDAITSGSGIGSALSSHSAVRFAVSSGATIAAFSGLVLLFYARSAHYHGGTSDRATVILEGQAMAAGHLLLQSWNLTFASYWTSDVPFYAVAIRLVGLRPGLLYAGPAVIAALVVVVGVLIAREGHHRAPGFVAGATVVALLGFATPAMAFFFVGMGFHVGTVLYSLLAFAALRRGRFGLGWALAVVLLAAGMLGDLMIVAYAVVPLALAGIVAGLRRRRWQSGIAQISAAALSAGIAELTRHFAEARGAFVSRPELSLVHASAIVSNLAHVPVYLADLLGLANGLDHNGGVPFGLREVHVVGALCVLVCLLVALYSLVKGAVRGEPEAQTAGESELWRLDDVLLITFFCSAVPFVAFARGDGASVRYLSLTVVFASVLAGRLVARGWTRLPSGRMLRAVAALGVAVSLSFAAGAGYALSRPAPLNEVGTLVSWLEAHHLKYGVADYWAASVTTVESKGDLIVRPVSASAGGALQQMTTLSSPEWYNGQEWQFLVYTKPFIDNVDLDAALRTWGPPARTYLVGPYHVVIWSYLISLPKPASAE